jgi:hypothetical protein
MVPQHPDPFGEHRSLTHRARTVVANLRESRVVAWASPAIVLAIWLGLVVLALVTGEGAGPG